MKAKTKFTKLWSILLALAMVVGMLPIAVLAAGSATAIADFSTDPTTALALLNAAKTGTTDSTWDSTTKTLTLNGVNFVTTATTAVKLPADSKIVLAAGTTNTIKGGDSSSEHCYGIYGVGDLTISGSGTLNVTGGEAGGSSLSFGIHAEANVTINSGAVTATGGAAPGNQSLGIRALNGNLTINGGTVTATGSDAKNSSNGLWAGNGSVTISGGKVVANGGGASSGTSSGIYAKNVVIQNTDNRIPHVTTRGGNGVRSRGIYANGGNLEISGGAVIAKAGYSDSAFALNKAPTLPTTPYWWRTSDSGDYSESAYTGDGSAAHLEIWNLDPMATADFTDNSEAALARLNAAKTGGAEDSTWEVDASGNPTLTLKGVHFVTTAATAVKLPGGATIVLADGTTNTIKGGDSSSEHCYGIYAEGSLTISGTGTLNVTGDTANSYSYGIYTNNGNISVTGGTVNAYGGNASYSFGIYAKQDMNIEDGTVNAYGGEAKFSRGIEAGNDISISGGIVNTKGGKATSFISYGIIAKNSLIISCGSLIAAGTSGSKNICALNMPSITLPDTPYWWRTSDIGAYTASTDTVYTLSSSHSYVEIRTAYAVNFIANGGTCTTSQLTTNAAGKLTSLPTPTRSGYTFKGWNTERDGTGDMITNDTIFTADTIVYAQWEVATVTIPSVAITGIDAPVSNNALDTEAVCATTGVSNAKPTVTWDSDEDTAGYGKTYTASVTLTAADGYAFADSVTATVNGNPATSVTKNANGTLTVTYAFPATDKHNIEITVDTDVRDGDAAKNPTISSGYEIEYCLFVEDTDKDGVFINKTGNSITLDDKTMVVDKALVEAFAAQSGGRFTYESLMAALKDEFDLDELKTEFTSGYDYSVLAYIYHSDNAYFDYDDNQIVTNAIVKANGKKITDNCLGYGGGMEIIPVAYVFSAAKTYTVSFDANGGKSTMADVTGISGEYTLPENGFTAPDGKQFKAWSVGGSEKAVGDKITVTANTTVTAVWEAIEYNVTVTGGTASVGAGTPITKATMGTTVTLTANAAPSGKVFDKWVVESGNINLADENSAITTFTMPDGAVSVKATYKTITYGDLNGDDKINLLDLIALRKHLAKWSIEIDKDAADCNVDGNINLLDLILMRKYLAKWNVVLGPQK